ncbi:MAG: hypothetical protein CMQ45_02255 [Gammaproteobacteria bacterium]|nr:hypothetical protein [Gammaproteobacteria bacterium]
MFDAFVVPGRQLSPNVLAVEACATDQSIFDSSLSKPALNRKSLREFEFANVTALCHRESNITNFFSLNRLQSKRNLSICRLHQASEVGQVAI